MRVTSALSCSIVVAHAIAVGGCFADPRPRLVACDSLAEEQPECMDDEALEQCVDANDACAESGVVEVGESCPLTFTCTAASGG